MEIQNDKIKEHLSKIPIQKDSQDAIVSCEIISDTLLEE
jgi:hypothetical protein